MVSSETNVAVSCLQRLKHKRLWGQSCPGKRYAGTLKPREPRHKALITARIRYGSAWGDVCLLNVSSRGALVQAPVPPPKGSYIEVRRGSQIIVARVMWAEQHRFGIYSQDPIAVDDLISGRAPTAHKLCDKKQDGDDRRRSPRTLTVGERHEQSRLKARSAEFFCLGAAATIAASLVFRLIQMFLAGSMSQVTAVLASH